mgnify:CR=1 FL=1
MRAIIQRVIQAKAVVDGETIGEAASDFAGKAQIAVEEANQKMEQMRREEASKIVVPGQGGSEGGIIT